MKEREPKGLIQPAWASLDDQCMPLGTTWLGKNPTPSVYLFYFILFWLLLYKYFSIYNPINSTWFYANISTKDRRDESVVIL